MKHLGSFLDDANTFIRQEFNIVPESILKYYDSAQWDEFCNLNSFDKNSEGLYVPKSHTAYVKDSPRIISNISHELFGHGLFCEYSLLGQNLPKMSDEDAKNYLFNPISQEQCFGLCGKNIGNYEGFALWLEELTCKETGNDPVWIDRKNLLPAKNLELLEHFQAKEKDLSRFYFMSQMGFPKYYDDKKIAALVKKLYADSIQNLDLVILYGSQKPYSDVDLFVVSENASKNYFNGWLDIYEINRQEFNHLVKNMDISVTDPLFSGRLVHGNDSYLERLKSTILSQHITEESINHNYERAKAQRKLLDLIPQNDKRHKDCLSYIESYSKNAAELCQGNRPLTLKNVLSVV